MCCSKRRQQQYAAHGGCGSRNRCGSRRYNRTNCNSCGAAFAYQTPHCSNCGAANTFAATGLTDAPPTYDTINGEFPMTPTSAPKQHGYCGSRQRRNGAGFWASMFGKRGNHLVEPAPQGSGQGQMTVVSGPVDRNEKGKMFVDEAESIYDRAPEKY